MSTFNNPMDSTHLLRDGRATSSSGDAPAERAGNGAIRLALVSSGLGNVTRGFEISTARWYDALRKHSKLDVRLFCGGSYPGGIRLWNFPRHSLWTRALHFIPLLSEQHRWELTYGVEQVSFWSALNFELLNWKPDAVWVKDVPLAHFILASRACFGLKLKVIFANGAMLKPHAYEDFDVIQQLERQAYEEALEYGIPDEKMELIGNCVPTIDQAIDRREVRGSLGLLDSDWVIVCVSAWNKYHKRIDYLLSEVANIPDSNVKLLLCGAPEVDADELRVQGKELLGDRVQWLTVAPDMLLRVLRASDVFVLPSLRESFGNAVVEAALCGLPVVVHPHSGARSTVKDEFWMTDLSQPGNLTERLLWLRRNASEASDRSIKLKSDVSARFNEEALAAKFEKMVLRVISREVGRTGSGDPWVETE